jgi:hypothetical protein
VRVEEGFERKVKEKMDETAREYIF